jgi:hypothetical protein
MNELDGNNLRAKTARGTLNQGVASSRADRLGIYNQLINIRYPRTAYAPYKTYAFY